MRIKIKFKLILAISIVAEIVLGVLPIIFLFQKQNSVGIDNYSKMFCTFDMVCILLSILFQIGCLIHFLKQHRFFFLCLIAELVGMLMDMFRQLFSGMPEYSDLHKVCVTVMYISTTTIIYAIFRFIIDTVVNINDNYKLLIKIVTVGYIISTAVRLGNIWFGYFSQIDGDGYCINQNLYILTALFPTCVIFVMIVLLFLTKMSVTSKAIILTTFVLSFVLGTASINNSNANIRYALFTIASIITYSVFFIEQRYYEYNRIKTFGGFLPQKVADKLLDGKTGETLAGKRLNVTLIKIRMCDYYSLIVDLNPEEKKLLFNRSMDMFVTNVENHGGIVINYEGDGALCAFGVPDIDHSHGDKAVNVAFDIINGLEELNEGNVKRGLPKINVALGMFSGIALFTCLKAGERTYYTPVTTIVDDCKRIANLAQPGQILIEQATLNDISVPIKAIYNSKYKSENTLYPISLYEAKHQESF